MKVKRMRNRINFEKDLVVFCKCSTLSENQVVNKSNSAQTQLIIVAEIRHITWKLCISKRLIQIKQGYQWVMTSKPVEVQVLITKLH